MTIKTCRSDEHQTTRPVSVHVNVRVGVDGGVGLGVWYWRLEIGGDISCHQLDAALFLPLTWGLEEGVGGRVGGGGAVERGRRGRDGGGEEEESGH